MKTEVLAIEPLTPDVQVLRQAAAVIQRGGLVAFPTETVYGLGANALDPLAVGRIYEAKGRPSVNPVIVHVAEVDEARRLARDWPEVADRLAEHFWPGPLTLVLLKRDHVPAVVTAGGETVAVRIPAHPVARGLIAAAGVPLAAPSANRSMRISPTHAQHVLRGLQGRIDLLLDGGPTTGGLESTVLDVSREPPRLLRPGLVTRDQLQAVIGDVALGDETGPIPSAAELESGPMRSPGLMSRHYAPLVPLERLSGDPAARVRSLRGQGLTVGLLSFGAAPGAEADQLIEMPQDAAAYSTQLYAALHALELAGVQRILVVSPPEADAWSAVHDRLARAAKS